ncbi:alpha-2,8-sialyltransferase 8F-like [Sinocyclocheilus anshuiensis]|uniref:alpha-2,8-sialyltransferase 8F-like n=1 Tax=Sinocyclocheilus anshuiensis TaxID=1608454 RepID=UPI0007BACF9F|nr:PREDICTED: alpha-2,8-sialyltransferase 8F-like [Sinocyclocheilus anshuiensis]
MTDALRQMHCAKLRCKFSMIKPAKNVKLQSFTRGLSDFMSCPYRSNTTEREVNRFNLASINDSDVGLKTDLITINPSQIRFKNLEQNPDPLVERVSVYGNASLAIPAFAYTFCTGQSIKTLKVLHPIRPQQPVAFFSPIYLRTLDRFWKGRGLKSIRLSTGFMLINTALELCEDVHVYGFWPFDTDLQDIPVPYHYYDQMKPHRYMHKMPEEFVRLLQLHSQGALTLHLQPCSSDTR